MLRAVFVVKPSLRALDPEMVCTRVVARLIEEIACVHIAPDSPVWSDLRRGDAVIGELRVYRGRGRVQKVVSLRYALCSPSLDAHSVVVFTQPESGVPHFELDSVRTGSRVALRVDLLPKRELASSPAYLERCYAPLSELRGELQRDVRFTPAPLPARQRALLSPFHALYTLDASDLHAAANYVDRYVTHWASLLHGTSPELDASPELAARDLAFRRDYFSRAVDPSWKARERAIGRESVDQILAALSS